MTGVYVLAQFADSDALFAAARRLREEGFQDLDAHSPYPLHGAAEALGLRRSRVPLFVLIGGLTGVALGYLMQWWMNAVDYPIIVGGRPTHSPPSNIPITFETGILLAVLSAFFGAMALFGLPRPYHPVFRVDAFRRASVDELWLSVRLAKGKDDAVSQILTDQGALQVTSVEDDE
ncbi:MAG TPA: DUF3341 domain-containing protein [Polyangia bacterium]|jgi:hypothetical protein|nr:DUF3341 domain-containing protein [Polyangia bacterium]